MSRAKGDPAKPADVEQCYNKQWKGSLASMLPIKAMLTDLSSLYRYQDGDKGWIYTTGLNAQLKCVGYIQFF